MCVFGDAFLLKMNTNDTRCRRKRMNAKESGGNDHHTIHSVGPLATTTTNTSTQTQFIKSFLYTIFEMIIIIIWKVVCALTCYTQIHREQYTTGTN